MRILKSVIGTSFARVVYVSAHALATCDVHSPWPRLWDLSRDGGSELLTGFQSALARWLFLPGGAHFLRAQGAWPDDEPLPVAEHGARIHDLLLVEGQSKWQPLAFGPDGATVLYLHAGRIGGMYQTHFHVRTPNGTVRPLFREWGMFPPSAAVSPNGRLAALANGLRVVGVWDVCRGAELFRLVQSGKTSAVAFLSDERLVVTAGRSVQLWDVTDGTSLTKFRAFKKFADALAVSPDGKLFAAGSRDGSVRLWETEYGTEVKQYEWGVGEVKDLAFSPDGTTAAAAGASAVAVWDL